MFIKTLGHQDRISHHTLGGFEKFYKKRKKTKNKMRKYMTFTEEKKSLRIRS